MRNKKLFAFLAVCFCAAAIIALASPPDCGAWGRGTFYVIGTGPAGPQTATLQALDTIKKMDYILAPAHQAKLFGDYIGKTPVLFNPWTGFFDYKGKQFWSLTPKEMAAYRVERFKIRDANMAKIKALMDQGKNVGLLDMGNPCLFGPSHWYVEQFTPEEVVIIPGMGCDAAAMAALKHSTIPAHNTQFVLQTAPFSLIGRPGSPKSSAKGKKSAGPQILKDLAKYDHTMVLYMALQDPVKLFAALGKYLPKDTPAACVFWAGYPKKERVVRGTIADMGAKLAKDKERFFGLLLIGKFLEGKPYEAAMRRAR